MGSPINDRKAGGLDLRILVFVYFIEFCYRVVVYFLCYRCSFMSSFSLHQVTFSNISTHRGSAKLVICVDFYALFVLRARKNTSINQSFNHHFARMNSVHEST